MRRLLPLVWGVGCLAGFTSPGDEYMLFALGGFHQVRGLGLLWRGVAVLAGSFVALNSLALVFGNLLGWLGVLDALERLLT